MAKVTITIEDSPDGKVRTVMEPSFEIIMMMVNSGQEMTSAHAYAVSAVNKIIADAKDQSQKQQLIYVPRLGR